MQILYITISLGSLRREPLSVAPRYQLCFKVIKSNRKKTEVPLQTLVLQKTYVFPRPCRKT